jgi:hypothetical protein
MLKKTITDVMHVPNISVNLLSVSKIADKGFILIFDKHECRVYRESDVTVKGVCNFSVANVQVLYKLRSVGPMSNQESATGSNVASNPNNVLAAVSQEIRVWHQRLGHLNSKCMFLLRDFAHGIPFEEKVQISISVPCIEAKFKRKTSKGM